LALDVLGVKQTQLYDGSWTEWGARDDTPIATKPP
jgi:thiosulfate/3-mercaptopyruvate sulfurtransferase